MATCKWQSCNGVLAQDDDDKGKLICIYCGRAHDRNGELVNHSIGIRRYIKKTVDNKNVSEPLEDRVLALI